MVLKESSLADICSLVTDGTHDTPKPVKNGYPLIKAKEIVGGKINFDSCDQITEEEHLKVISRSKPEYGDTLFAHIGASLGEAAFVKTHRPFSIKNVALFKPNDKIIDPRYLYYLVISPAFQGLAKQTKTGSAQPFLSLGHLRAHRIVYHEELNAQRKIASILSAYDDLIENNLRRIKILEEMAQNLYREWFVKFRFPGHENVRFVDSPMGRTPEGWEVEKLSELVTTQYGYTESAQEKPIGPKYLRGMDINKSTYIDWNSVPYCAIADEQFSKYQLSEGDIVVIRMADPGKVGIVESNVRAVFASYLVRLTRTSNRIGPYYLFYFLIDEQYQGYITGASTGTTRKSASAGVLTSIDIVYPPASILSEFENQVRILRRFLINIVERNTTLRHTRDLLLPKLISGEVDVSELDVTILEEIQ